MAPSWPKLGEAAVSLVGAKGTGASAGVSGFSERVNSKKVV